MLVNRRNFIAAAGALGATASLDPIARALALGAQPLGRVPDGRLIGTVPLGRFDGRPAPPPHVLLGAGLDARQFVDLSSVDEQNLITANDRFFVRTSRPGAELPVAGWSLELGGRVVRPDTLTLDALAPLVRAAGTHLIECAGNNDPANFGLMSAARWDGVPVAALLDRVRPQNGSWRVQVTGVDESTGDSRSSQAGASWVFTRDDLERTGAFLATAMNGAPLPRNHGAPARLVVPGWYGCSCIKWVSRIDLVPDDAPVTSQMVEFARRTHQEGQPAFAKDYLPPAIDLAAVPVRVEHWIVDGRPVYRIVGLMWGGERPTRALAIRFRHDEPFVPVSNCEMPASTTTWSIWSHLWRPAAPGQYRIVLECSDPTIRTRRLDLFFYAREVDIAQTA